ncbi:MMPL family transporter [bacterium]|nr:MMPL family transporter [bacterium]
MKPEDTQLPTVFSLRRRILRNVALLLYRHAFLAVLLLLALTALSAWRISDLQVSTNLRTRAPAAPAEQAAWESMRLAVRPYSPITAVVRIKTSVKPDEETRQRVARMLLEAWDDPTYIASVMQVEPRAEFETSDQLGFHEMLIRLRREDLKNLQDAADPQSGPETARRILGASLSKTDNSTRTLAVFATDPFGLMRILREREETSPGRFPTTLPHASLMSPDERNLVFVLRPVKPSSEVLYCQDVRNFILKTTDAAIARLGLGESTMKIGLYGRHISASETFSHFEKDMLRATIVMGICIALLLILAFRKIESFFFIFIPPILGLLWTYGLASLFLERLSILSAVFPVILMALGVEFVVQIYHRFTEELYREERYYPALGLAYTEAGRGIVVSTLATAIIFFSLQLSPFRALRELALVGGLGTICMAAASLLALPPMAAIKSRLSGGSVRPMETYDFGLRGISGAVISSPRSTIALGLLITAYLAFYARDTRFNQEIGLDMTAPETLALHATPKRLPQASIGDEPLSILVEGATLQEALGRNDLLYDRLLEKSDSLRIGAIRSLSPVLPSVALQQAVRRDLNEIDLDQLEKNLQQTARDLDLPPQQFNPFLATLGGLRRYGHDTPPLDRSSLADTERLRLAQRQIVRDRNAFRVLTTIFPKEGSPLLDTEGFQIFQRGFATNPHFSLHFQSETLQNEKVARTVIRSMALTVLFSILSIVVCLFPHFKRDRKDVFLASVPIICAVIWTLGLLAIFNVELGLYGMLTLPLVVGIAVDQAILLIQRMHDRQYASLRQVTRSAGRPGLIVSLILLLSLGTLVQVRFQPLREMSGALLIAVLFATLSALILIPSALQVRQEGGLANWQEERET